MHQQQIEQIFQFYSLLWLDLNSNNTITDWYSLVMLCSIIPHSKMHFGRENLNDQSFRSQKVCLHNFLYIFVSSYIKGIFEHNYFNHAPNITDSSRPEMGGSTILHTFHKSGLSVDSNTGYFRPVPSPNKFPRASIAPP